MQKFKVLALCLMAAFFLTNCDGEASSDGDSDGGDSSASSASSTVNLEKDKAVTNGDYTFTLQSVEESDVMRPDGERKQGMGAHIKIEGPDGGVITSLLKGDVEEMGNAGRVGDRPISYVLDALDAEKQTATLSKKVGEPLE